MHKYSEKVQKKKKKTHTKVLKKIKIYAQTQQRHQADNKKLKLFNAFNFM